MSSRKPRDEEIVRIIGDVAQFERETRPPELHTICFPQRCFRRSPITNFINHSLQPKLKWVVLAIRQGVRLLRNFLNLEQSVPLFTEKQGLSDLFYLKIQDVLGSLAVPAAELPLAVRSEHH